MNNLFSGTSNLVLPVKNKSYFPPEFQNVTRLTYYSSLFSSIEVNASFYKMPHARTVLKWSEEVRADFRFSFKMIQAVTHSGPQFNLEPIPDFLHRISVTEKRGCLLVQLPPKFAFSPIQLHHLLFTLKDSGWPIAVEFRHPGWYNEQTFDLLRQFNATLVIHDLTKSAAPMEITADHIYLRFHGPDPGYRGSYADDYLAEYASYIREWMTEGKTVYVYFNNTLGAAVQNLRTLTEIINLQK